MRLRDQSYQFLMVTRARSLRCSFRPEAPSIEGKRTPVRLMWTRRRRAPYAFGA